MQKYYLTTRAKLFDLITGGVMLTMCGFTILHSLPFLLPQILIGGITVFGLMCLGVLVASPSITVSADGIEHSQPFRDFKVEWKGFDRIGKRWLIEGLIIHSGYLVTLRNTIPPNTKAISTPFLFYDFIPMSRFSDNWRDSELGQQIKQHAPHLFEKEKSA